MTLVNFISITLATLVAALLLALLIISTITDLKSRKISNRLTYSACLLAFVLNALSSLIGVQRSGDLNFLKFQIAIPGTIGIGASFIGALGCFIVMLVLYDLAGSGGGDLKLATALGACLGLQTGLYVILWCHLMAGAVLLVWATTTAGPVKVSNLIARSAGSQLLPGIITAPQQHETELLQTPVPLAGFFAVAVCLSLVGTQLP